MSSAYNLFSVCPTFCFIYGKYWGFYCHFGCNSTNTLCSLKWPWIFHDSSLKESIVDHFHWLVLATATNCYSALQPPVSLFVCVCVSCIWFLILFLNWCTVDLQYCVSLRCTAMIQSHIYTHILFQYRLLQDIEYSSLCCLSILYTVICIC